MPSVVKMLMVGARGGQAGEHEAGSVVVPGVP